MPGETAQAYLIPYPCNSTGQASDIYQTRDAPLPLVTKSAGVGVVFHELAPFEGSCAFKALRFPRCQARCKVM